MIPCRSGNCRSKTKEWLQVEEDRAVGRMAERKLRLKDGSVAKGPWVGHKGRLVVGMYCGHCGNDLEYSPQDLSDYRLDDPPFLFVPPEDFRVDEALKAMRKKWGKRIAYVKVIDPQPERFAESAILGQLRPELTDALKKNVLPPGKQLYLHQGEAVRAALQGEHVVIVTATASGKTLCYQLPVLNRALCEMGATALYLSPLKALGADQFDSFCRFDPEQASRPATGEEVLENFYRRIRIGQHELSIGIHDGNTPEAVKPKIKYELHPNILISTPDWLSLAVLSRSQEWGWFFERLRFVVIDEMHVYRGIFGSNFANLMRRLRRLCSLYGAKPQFLFCSATVRNPGDLAQQLLGRIPGDQVTVIGPEQDGSPKRRRQFVLMRGTEDTLTTDARKLLVEILAHQRASVIAFGRSIPAVNRIYRDTQQAVCKELGVEVSLIQPFMAPLPPAKKREIARRLNVGELRGVVSTTALQLGIDIGNFSAGVLAGYPGSIAATWQQAGRAGRRGEGLYVLLADKDPIDQFWVDHPEMFFAEEPEEVVVDPDNKYVLLNHLWCAHKDLEIDEARDAAFFGRDFRGCLEELKKEGKVQNVVKKGRDVWVLTDENGFPAKEVPLRNPLGKDVVRVLTDHGAEPIAYEDSYRATKRLHRFAIYSVIDDDFAVDELVLEGPVRYAKVHRVTNEESGYFTSAVSQDSSEVIDTKLSRETFGLPLSYGDVNFTSEVVAYVRHFLEPRKGREREFQPLGKARPPKRSFDTKATWIDFPQRLAGELGRETLYNALNSIGSAVVSATGILRFADPNDLGALVETKETARLTIHEQYPGGIGLAERCYYRFEELLQRAYEILADCDYCTRHPESKGCPRCAVSADDRHDRQAALKVIEEYFKQRADTGLPRTPSQVVSALGRLGYQEIEILDSGGMGAVYRGVRDGRPVALKVIEPRFWRENRGARELLLQEGKVWQGLAHPNVLRLYSIQEQAGVLFLEMEFAGYGTLYDQIGTGLSAERAIPLFRAVCDGVAYLHGNNIVHRDLKPHNVLFVQPGVPKVADFGLAKALTGKTASTWGGGTPGYWAPEQRSERGRVSCATDVYALGVILYEMLAGHLPTFGSTGQTVSAGGVAIPAPLLGIVERCTDPDPAQRFADAGQLRDAIAGM